MIRNIVYSTVLLSSFFFIARSLHLKKVFHFRLLKEMYPDKFCEIKSSFHFNISLSYFKLDPYEMIWFWTPIYYSAIPKNDFKGEALRLHIRLMRNNKVLAISFASFLSLFFLSKYIDLIFN